MPPIAPAAARRVRPIRARLAGAAVLLGLGAVGARGGADAAPGAGDWVSSTKGLAVRGISSIRITSKTPEVWYASIFGPKKTRGVCENTSKGTKPWVSKMTGLDEAVSARDAWRITVDPKDDKTLYAVSRGKIFKSTNAGQTWEFAGNGTATFSFDRSQSRPFVVGVEVDPSNSKRVLAGTWADGFHGGLFESKDGAKSWTQLAGTGDRKDLEQSGLGGDAWPVTLDKGSDKFLLVGGRRVSASLSANRGGTFKSTQPLGAGIHRAYELTPMVSREVFLAESRGLWRSRDAGESWGKAPILSGTCISVDVDPGNRKVVYAILEGKGLVRTENLTTWTAPLHPEIDAHEVLCDPHAKSTILLGSRTTGLWISTDRGETVAPLLARPEDIPEVVPAIACVAAHPAAPTFWLAATDTGTIFSSADRGASWSKVGNLRQPVRRLVANPAAPGAWVATGAGVFASADGGATWSTAWAPADPEERVAAIERLSDGTWLALLEREARVVASRDGGKTWDADAFKRPQGTKTAWGAALAVNPRDPKHLLVATRSVAEPGTKDDRDGGPFESKDGGATWTALDGGMKSDKGALRDGFIRGAVCGIDANHGTLYYGADGLGLLRMEPLADGKPGTWTDVPLTGAPAQPRVRAFRIWPATPDTAIASTLLVQVEDFASRATLLSSDDGRTFAAIADPGTTLGAVSEDPALPGRWLAGDATGDRGVLSFDPPGGVPAIAAPVVPKTPEKPVVEPPPAPPADTIGVSGGRDRTIRGHDFARGAALPASPPFGGEVLCFATSKDGAVSAIGLSDRTVLVVDVTKSEPRAKFEVAAGAVQSVAISADGATVYAGDAGFGISVFDVASGQAVGTLAGHTGAVNALVLSADGTRLFSGSADASVRAWDVAAKKELYAIPGHPGEVYALALSPDGAKVYVGGRDPSVRAYDAAQGAPAATWASPIPTIEAMRVSPEGSVLYLAGGAKELHAIGTGDGQAMFVYTGSAAKLGCLALSADGEWILAGAEDGQQRLWKKGRAEAVSASGALHEGAVRCVKFAAAPPATPPAPAPDPAAPAPDPAPAPAPAPGMDAPPAPAPGPAPEPGMETPPAPAGMG